MFYCIMYASDNLKQMLHSSTTVTALTECKKGKWVSYRAMIKTGQVWCSVQCSNGTQKPALKCLINIEYAAI